MSFLKKYYDKLILIVLLLVFVALLSMELFSMMFNVKKTPEQALDLRQQNPDYRSLNIKDEYSVFENLQTAAKIIPNSQTRAKNKTNIFLPPELIPCPLSEEGRIHFIPAADFKNKKCSFCKKQMDAVDESSFGGAGGMDSDGDGIPDTDERRLGLNPTQKDDGMRDDDDDGFTNAEEYKGRTNMKDAKSRPSYAKRLYVQKIAKQSLGITVLGYDVQSQDTKNWTVQVETRIWQKRKRRWIKDTAFVKIGDTIKSYNIDYKLEKIEKDIQFDEAQGINVNKSRLFLVRSGLDIKFIGTPGQEIVDPRQKVSFFFDVPFEHSNDISAFVGGSFVVGDKKRRTDTFTVISVDNNRNTVRLREKRTKREYEIKSIKDRPQPNGPEQAPRMQQDIPPMGGPRGRRAQAGF